MTEVAAPTRPALRYHGGKWLLAPWIIEHLPAHKIYVEPFGGAASVLLRKPRAYAEIYNDLCDDVVNLFQVLRSPKSEELIDAIRLTAFARVEFELAYELTEDPIERARRLVIRSFMGFGSDGHNIAVKTGFRANANRLGTTPAHDWSNLPASVANVAERFRGVVIEHRPAVQVMLSQDGTETLHYVDPPYLPETRSQKSRKNGQKYHAYTHEMSVDDHIELLDCLTNLTGMVVLSGYPSDLYDDALNGWTRHERKALADGARKRTEVLWINPAAASSLGTATLFGWQAESTQ